MGAISINQLVTEDQLSRLYQLDLLLGNRPVEYRGTGPDKRAPSPISYRSGMPMRTPVGFDPRRFGLPSMSGMVQQPLLAQQQQQGMMPTSQMNQGQYPPGTAIPGMGVVGGNGIPGTGTFFTPYLVRPRGLKAVIPSRNQNQ
jgi:hypothetical protein